LSLYREERDLKESIEYSIRGFERIKKASILMLVSFLAMGLVFSLIMYVRLSNVVVFLTYIVWMAIFMVSLFVYLAPGLDAVKEYNPYELRFPIIVMKAGLFPGIILAALAISFNGLIVLIASLLIVAGWIGLSITLFKLGSIFKIILFHISGALALISTLLFIIPDIGFPLWIYINTLNWGIAIIAIKNAITKLRDMLNELKQSKNFYGYTI